MIRQDHPSRSSFFARKNRKYLPTKSLLCSKCSIVKLFRRSYGTQHNPSLPIRTPVSTNSWCVVTLNETQHRGFSCLALQTEWRRVGIGPSPESLDEPTLGMMKSQSEIQQTSLSSARCINCKNFRSMLANKTSVTFLSDHLTTSLNEGIPSERSI